MNWTKEEEDLVRQFYGVPNGPKILSRLLDRGGASISIKAMRLGVMHYMYAVRKTLTVEMMRKNTALNNETKCWIWSGPKVKPNGYGSMAIDRTTRLAHRVMFKAAFPEINIEGLSVCHHCDTPACVNPEHLYAGTQSQNIRDCVARGRHRWNKKK